MGEVGGRKGGGLGALGIFGFRFFLFEKYILLQFSVGFLFLVLFQLLKFCLFFLWPLRCFGDL